MRRISCPERIHWKQRARELGFAFHTMDGQPYWDESAYYSFSLRQIEDDLEAPTQELHALCMALVERAVQDEQTMRRLGVPEWAFDFVAMTFRRGDPTLYGRFDFSYDGKGPAKLLEYNADTPTALYEAGVFQWFWLEDQTKAGVLPAGADQFNSIHDRLIAAFQLYGQGRSLHLTSVPDSIEDRGTVAYLEDCARQAGMQTHFVAIGDIGLTREGQFVDEQNRPIERIFKLYPWEWLFAEEFGKAMPHAAAGWMEPPWKALLSNKAILPLLWEMAPGHPNLLPAFFEGDPRQAELGARYARKPIHSREGANIRLVDGDTLLDSDSGPYGQTGFIRQALAPLPVTQGNHAVIGSWVIAGEAAGIGIREDRSAITKNTSRFLPHVIMP